MSLEERIREAVTPIVPEFAADVYTGDADSYCVLNATEMPDGFGDDRPSGIWPSCTGISHCGRIPGQPSGRCGRPSAACGAAPGPPSQTQEI